MIMATVASLERDSGATFLIDGEEEPTTKRYTSGSFNLNVGDRVVLEEVGDSYTVISKPGSTMSFDCTTGDSNRYIQLKPERTYLLVETCYFYNSNGQRTWVNSIKAALAATPVAGNTNSSEVIALTSSSPFSSANSHRVYYSKTYGLAHVSIIEL